LSEATASAPGLVNARTRTTLELVTLVEREAPSILDYFGRRSSSPEDAADLLSDTLLVIWRRAKAIPIDDTEARMWMFGVARKVLATHRRSAGRRAGLTEKLMSVTPGEEAAHDGLRELIDALGDPDREIVRLHYWEGFSLIEVAGILGMRDATVRSRMARARTKLRNQLER
jgi:RNA polymerase sigma-70 factor (ECF subfamily)